MRIVIVAVAVFALSGCDLFIRGPRTCSSQQSGLTSGAMAPCPPPRPPDAGQRDTLCDEMTDRTATLRVLIAACPKTGDTAVTSYDDQSCEANAAAACSMADRTKLVALVQCEAALTPCADVADRGRLDQQLQACATDAGTPSTGCELALGR